MDIETLILAGGKSSRMGQDKALLRINNKPLLLDTYSIAKEISNRVYIITYNIEKYKEILPSDVILISDSQPFQGALMAFAQGLKYVKSEWVFLLACDLPCLTLKEVKLWVSQLSQIPSEVMAFLPQNEKGWDCLCGFYRSSCYSSLNIYLQTNNRSFQRWLNQEKVRPIQVKNKQVLFNCNTVQDYQSIGFSEKLGRNEEN
ncbi:molybdenum cofactor guanylyltransferase [Cyanobacterium aponinum UTEX 3221]|uniref:molybdenum cofactor guanylyltransferase n=1 Tax=Cyanobacterium aponinum TaxID=379064 RepID=UPI002B4C0FF2|nr:molybdenum cofactor guanylyltransferase [Cyanobacterium aponinum]WRL40117.1 molybdenum cofactor guanylyltransferase [Cyanobacterium aponinum UTEX 3221]